MTLVPIKLENDTQLKDLGLIKSGKKGETIEVSEATAKWEVDAKRATYVKQEDKKKPE